MQKLKTDNRSRLIRAALDASYRYGFAETSIADIAKGAKVPTGNVYYYFKTKDEIGAAIIDQRLSWLRSFLQELDKVDSPKERLCGFVQRKIDDREKLARTGCPVGTLCSELHKQGGPVANRSTVLFAEALSWMEAQFKAIGNDADPRGLAVHLLSATQGVSVLAHTFHDPGLVDLEAARLKEWIRSL
jgi:AcrR family transcriptional regulator